MRPGIDRDQFVKLAIVPGCQELGRALNRKLNTRSARQLLLVTAAVESNCGQYLKQIRGPACGAFQEEPATLKWVNEELYQRGLTSYFRPDPLDITTDLVVAAIACRARYWLVPDALPEADNAMHMWVYYKKWWNSSLGATTRQKFMKAWEKWDVSTIK